MARIGISITKSVAFRDSVQEFSNVYYYENGGALPNAAGADALIDELVVMEKTFHSTLVTFVRGRLWSQVGTPSGNNMISQKNLSGVGSAVSDSGMDKERAFLFRVRAGVDSRGTPVYLRKWYHTCGTFPGAGAISSGILANATGFAQGARDTMASNWDNTFLLSASGGGWTPVAKSGRAPSTATAEAHKYLEHHQLGDQWRAT
jgi:hypothetical protein